ncbi:Uncharacterised protein [uncultured Eubacterium sp.]|nr:Uncharacterised protein [uncultured Eubacterium sp.]
MKLMKTAEEMMQFCVENNTGVYSFKDLKHFKVIEDSLQTGEYALLCFVGSQMVDRAYNSTKDRRCCLALTNIRLIMGQRSGMGDDLQFIWYKDLNGMELTKNSIMVDAAKNWPCIQIITEGVPYLQEEIPDIMEAIKQKKAIAKVTKRSSSADEIRKFKGLLDDGIITEEEFLGKKKQLLDGGDTLEQQESGSEIVIDINPAEYRSAGGFGVVSENVAETNVKAAQKEENEKVSGVYLPGCIFGGIVLFIGFIAFINLIQS